MNKWMKLSLKVEAKQRQKQSLSFAFTKCKNGIYMIGEGIVLVVVLVEIVMFISLMSL